MPDVHRRRLAWILAFAGTIVAGCAATLRPEPCPQTEYRRLTCPNGARLGTYQPTLNLDPYCDALPLESTGATPELVRRLPDGSRAIALGGASGWLILPAAPDAGDAPEQLRRWWRLRDCVPTP